MKNLPVIGYDRELASEPLQQIFDCASCTAENPCLLYYPDIGFRYSIKYIERGVYGDYYNLKFEDDVPYLSKYDGPINPYAVVDTIEDYESIIPLIFTNPPAVTIPPSNPAYPGVPVLPPYTPFPPYVPWNPDWPDTPFNPDKPDKPNPPDCCEVIDPPTPAPVPLPDSGDMLMIAILVAGALYALRKFGIKPMRIFKKMLPFLFLLVAIIGPRYTDLTKVELIIGNAIMAGFMVFYMLRFVDGLQKYQGKESGWA